MFMTSPNAAQAEQLSKTLRRVRAIYGDIPAQMQFLGDIDAEYLDAFLVNVLRTARHPHIDPDLFGFLRLHLAYREGYAYCQRFNTALLLSRDYTQSQLDAAVDDIGAVPFDARHQTLASAAIHAILEPHTFTQPHLDQLHAMDWSQKDIFDAIAHTGDLLKNGRILEAYTDKTH
jgi:hypothetical protein